MSEDEILDSAKPETPEPQTAKFAVFGIVLMVPNLFFLLFGLKRYTYAIMAGELLAAIMIHLVLAIVMGVVLRVFQSARKNTRRPFRDLFIRAYFYTALGMFALLSGAWLIVPMINRIF